MANDSKRCEDFVERALANSLVFVFEPTRRGNNKMVKVTLNGLIFYHNSYENRFEFMRDVINELRQPLVANSLIIVGDDPIVPNDDRLAMEQLFYCSENEWRHAYGIKVVTALDLNLPHRSP